MGGRMWPQGGGVTSITAAWSEGREVPVERWGRGAVMVREEEGGGEEPQAARAMTIGERIKARLAALAGGDQGVGQRQAGVGAGAGMRGGNSAAKPFAASEEAAVVGEESVEEMRVRMRHVQLEVMKLKAQHPVAAAAGAVAAVAPTLPPPDQPAVFVTNVSACAPLQYAHSLIRSFAHSGMAACRCTLLPRQEGWEPTSAAAGRPGRSFS